LIHHVRSDYLTAVIPVDVGFDRGPNLRHGLGRIPSNGGEDGNAEEYLGCVI
jgi:hypothetical protein